MGNQQNIAVVGSGYWGKNLVRNFAALGSLRTVVEPSESGQAQARQIAPDAKIVNSLSEALEDAAIRGVVIATPAVTHAALSEQALLAGRDVMCEKPLALSYRDAARVAEIAKVRGAILMVGHILEYHPAFGALRSLIANGDLGELRYIYSNRTNLGKVRREENILWSFAPHDIAVILRLVGSMPFQVMASGGAYLQPNVADVTVTQLKFDSGVAGHIFVSWLNPFKEQKLVVVGSKKMAVFDDVRRELVVYDQRVDVGQGEPVPIKGEGTLVAYPADEPLRLECQAFVDAIRTREQPLTDASSGLRVLRVLQAAQRSLMTGGQPVQMPLEP
ncbi:MAG: Gfo/Idh/MocA family oxidoreductase [Polyangiaceae bacterium]|nr:Gfo/Idh/MocA family oxidoreductase [Polyangiaceae bacterium]